MTGECLTRYQAILIDNPEIILKICNTLNPASLMPTETEVEHSCEQIISQTYASRADLRDQPLPNPEEEWYTDGSSYMLNGERKAGYAVVGKSQIIEAQPLPPDTSAQKAEIIALTRALSLGKDKRLNIYTDSKYAFLVLHAHAAIWKERGLLTVKRSPVKHGPEILQLLEAVNLPKEVAVIHCKGHQKENSPVAEGNKKADKEVKSAALKTLTSLALFPFQGESIDPTYSPEEELKAKNNGGQKQGSWWLMENKFLLPQSVWWKAIKLYTMPSM